MSSDNTSGNHAPLIPMSEIFTSRTTANADAATTATRDQTRKGTYIYTLDLIESEINNLTSIQTSNNEEIKKRLTDIQKYRENNLVVVGALGGMKKMREKLQTHTDSSR